MLDKYFFTIIGLIIAAFAICNVKTNTVEDFWGLPTRTVKVMREVHPKGAGNSCGAYSLQNNYQAMLGNGKFVSTPSFQPLLSPRFSNVGYGSSIRYNAPDYKNQGVPCEPMTFGEMVNEGYSDSKEDYGCTSCSGNNCRAGCTVPKCGKGGLPQISKSRAAGPVAPDKNYALAASKVYSENSYPAATDLVAVGDMTTINSDGTVSQPIVYNRYIYANQKSRLRAQGDPIRGDLAIAPCNNGWFNVSAHPNIDLQQGAMNVMGGVTNDTTKALSDLIYASSGGTDPFVAGVNLASGVNMSNQFSSSLGDAGRTVSVSSFP